MNDETQQQNEAAERHGEASELSDLLSAIDDVLTNALLSVDNDCHFADHDGRSEGLPCDMKALYQIRQQFD